MPFVRVWNSLRSLVEEASGIAKKATWIQAGFRVLGMWFFLQGGFSLGLRLTPAFFPGKFLTLGFPSNLLSLLLGAALLPAFGSP